MSYDLSVRSFLFVIEAAQCRCYAEFNTSRPSRLSPTDCEQVTPELMSGKNIFNLRYDLDDLEDFV